MLIEPDIEEIRNEPLLCVRPGAHIYPLSADELQVSFPNYTATFVSPPVVRGVIELLKHLQEPATKAQAVACVARVSGLEPALLEYLVSMMANSHCLYESTTRERASGSDELSRFYAYAGTDPASTVDKLRASRVVVIEGDGGEAIDPVLDQVGLRTQTLQVKRGSSVRDVVTAVRERISTTPRALACWGVPYRLPLALAINDLAISEGIPVLFGCSEGFVGRVGPFVLPRASSCLDCMNRRLLANAGARESTAYAQYRAQYADTLPDPWPTHPTWRSVVLRLYALELANVLLDQPPQTLGGFLEYSYPNGVSRRHPVYRVPRCPSCHEQRPLRWAWDVRLPSAAEATAAE